MAGYGLDSMGPPRGAGKIERIAYVEQGVQEWITELKSDRLYFGVN
jgi:hypothetical protein